MPALLRKQRVTVPRISKALTTPELAVKVKELLGYNLLDRATATAVAQQTLAGVLKELDISVFNPRSVQKYKERQRQKQQHQERHSWTRWSWHQIALSRYQKAVPLAALQTALRIAERIPEARFIVEELRKTHARPRTVDPFLYVAVGSVRYYIAQWDEPSFSDEQ